MTSLVVLYLLTTLQQQYFTAYVKKIKGMGSFIITKGMLNFLNK